MESLIEDILILARQNGAVEDRTDLNLGAVAKRAWETVETGDVELTVVDGRVISAGESWLIEIFENLFRNAIEHGFPTEQSQSEPTVTVGVIDGGFYVEDNGSGIPVDDQHRVFEEGFSESSSGTGLGLSIVSELVDAHGWTITATESDSGGARFEVTGVE
jgi:signal transduction histidine kinase